MAVWTPCGQIVEHARASCAHPGDNPVESRRQRRKYGPELRRRLPARVHQNSFGRVSSTAQPHHWSPLSAARGRPEACRREVSGRTGSPPRKPAHRRQRQCRSSARGDPDHRPGTRAVHDPCPQRERRSGARTRRRHRRDLFRRGRDAQAPESRLCARATLLGAQAFSRPAAARRGRRPLRPAARRRAQHGHRVQHPPGGDRGLPRPPPSPSPPTPSPSPPSPTSS